ncbi:MAG: ABC transporter substrate-binding protein [Dehalococcoidia bacterium]|nr:ABC transporter substrate-binding protein [Dehalococcoidia bacterium]
MFGKGDMFLRKRPVSVRRKLLAIGIMGVLVVALGACASAAAPTPPPAAQPTSKPAAAATPAAAAPTSKPAAKALDKAKISLPTAGASHLPIYFAKEKGYFAEEGVDMEVLVISAPLTIPALLNGEIDYTFLLGSSLLAALKGEPIRVVMVTKDKPAWTIFLALGLSSAQQIEGKSWGISSGGTATYAAQEAIRYLKLDQNKITFVRFPADEEMLLGLKAGSIVAASLTPPTSNKAAEAGMKLLLDTADIMEAPTGGISTTLNRMQQNPDQVKRVLRAVLKAMDYIKGHQDEAAQFIATKFSLEKTMAQAIVADETGRWARDGTVSDRGLQSHVEIVKADPQAGLPDVTLDQVKKVLDYTLLTQAKKELGLPRQ